MTRRSSALPAAHSGPIHISNSASLRHTPAASRRVARPSFAAMSPSSKAEGAGKAGSSPPPWPPCEQNARGRNHRFGLRHPGLPCAMVLTLIRALPGDRLSCPHVATTRDARCARHQLRDARTTRFHVRVLPFVRELLLRLTLIGKPLRTFPDHARPLRPARVHRIPLPTSVTIAIRPSAERNERRIRVIWGKRQAIYVFPNGLTRGGER